MKLLNIPARRPGRRRIRMREHTAGSGIGIVAAVAVVVVVVDIAAAALAARAARAAPTCISGLSRARY